MCRTLILSLILSLSLSSSSSSSSEQEIHHGDLDTFLEDVLFDPNGEIFKCRSGESERNVKECDAVFERERRHVSMLLEMSREVEMVSIRDMLERYFPHDMLSESHLRDMENALKFVNAASVSSANENNQSILIVGGGPAGLLTAIEAHRRGCRQVRVVEKRRYHSRKVWFDILSSQLGFRGLDTLKSFGLEFLHLFRTSVTEAPGTLTIPCRTLEMFLARVLLLLDNVRIDYETQFEGFTENGFAILRKTNENNSTCDSNIFDIVVAADGTRSSVRDAMGIDVNTLERFGSFTLKDLKQTTTILSVRVDSSSGRCPPLRTIEEREVSPFDPAFEHIMNGSVTSAWKRWNPPFCEIQVLWSHEFAQDRSQSVEKKLLDLMSVILRDPPSNLKEFRDMLDKRSGDVNIQTYDVRISRASRLVKSIGGGDVTVVLIGDAAQSSHYRLGVGINRVFDVVDIFGNAISTNNFDAFARDATEVRSVFF